MLPRAIICLGAALVVACSGNSFMPSESANPSSPSPVPDLIRTAEPSSTPPRTVGRANVVVNMFDNCDDETFNAAIEPGTCTRNGGMKFEHFIEQLTRLGFVGPWHFSPNLVNAREGQTFVVTNRGGEAHTFTEVEEFGGGFIPFLNQLAGVPVPAPECLTLSGADFIAPGQTVTEPVEAGESEKYQCCLHPWMKLTTRADAP